MRIPGCPRDGPTSGFTSCGERSRGRGFGGAPPRTAPRLRSLQEKARRSASWRTGRGAGEADPEGIDPVQAGRGRSILIAYDARLARTRQGRARPVERGVIVHGGLNRRKTGWYGPGHSSLVGRMLRGPMLIPDPGLVRPQIVGAVRAGYPNAAPHNKRGGRIITRSSPTRPEAARPRAWRSSSTSAQQVG
jgi:hypothetical protein